MSVGREIYAFCAIKKEPEYQNGIYSPNLPQYFDDWQGTSGETTVFHSPPLQMVPVQPSVVILKTKQELYEFVFKHSSPPDQEVLTEHKNLLIRTEPLEIETLRQLGVDLIPTEVSKQIREIYIKALGILHSGPSQNLMQAPTLRCLLPQVPQYPVSQYPVSQYPVSQYPVSQHPVSQHDVQRNNTVGGTGLPPNGFFGSLPMSPLTATLHFGSPSPDLTSVDFTGSFGRLGAPESQNIHGV